MKKILTFIMLVSLLQADTTINKVVYDLTTKSVKLFEKNILKGIVANKTHYENNLLELEIAVVIHGGAYKFFVKDLTTTLFKDDLELSKIYDNLKKRIKIISDTYEVEFLMCGAAMERNQLEKDQIVDFVKIIPNSTIGLIDKQNEGFAYIPVK